MDIQLVLGSGGVRCFSYIGAIQELKERGYTVRSVSGVSAGALVALLMAAGISGQDMEERLLSLDMTKLPRRKPLLRGLWRLLPPDYSIYGESVPKELLLSLLDGPDPKLSTLQIPFASVGLDLRTGRLFIYSTRSEPDMHASDVIAIATAVPGLFPACKSHGRILIDGALASECPVWLAGAHDRPEPVLALRTEAGRSWRAPKHAGDFYFRAVKAGILGGDAALSDAFSNSAEIAIHVDEDEMNLSISRDRRQLLIDEGRRQIREKFDQGQIDFSAAKPGLSQSPESSDAARRFIELTAPKDTVFISYSRRDAQTRDELVATLENELADLPALRLWADTQIKPGEEWEREITRAMHRTRVAVLLVSKAFLKSSFIKSEEEPFFIKAAKANVLSLLWVNVDIELDPTDPRLSDLITLNAINPTPLSQSADRQAIWRKVAQSIEQAFQHA
jgi:predicted acylesterase/phospholipase RssA